VGTQTSPVPSTTANASPRRAGLRARISTAPVAPAMPNAPGTPPGTTTVADGIAAQRWATCTNHHTAGPAIRTTSSPAAGHVGSSTVASTPSKVAIPTAGAARMLASTATRLSFADRPAITGAVTTKAASGTANSSATPAGTPRVRMPSAHPGASSTNPAVASTDSAKPASTASWGYSIRSTMTAPHNAGTACFLRPVTKASKAIAPITAARRTLGEGLATMTKPTSAAAANTAHVRGPAPTSWASSSTAPHTMVIFVPDIAI